MKLEMRKMETPVDHNEQITSPAATTSPLIFHQTTTLAESLPSSAVLRGSLA